jgi:F-type H+-transporting ATPase subunit b
LKNLNKRESIIKSLKDETENLNKKADKLIEEYNISIANAKKESIDIINKAKAEAITEQNRIISEAKDEFKEMVDDAKKKIHAETETASLKLKEGAEPLSRLLAKKVLGREVN